MTNLFTIGHIPISLKALMGQLDSLTLVGQRTSYTKT